MNARHLLLAAALTLVTTEATAARRHYVLQERPAATDDRYPIGGGVDMMGQSFRGEPLLPRYRRHKTVKPRYHHTKRSGLVTISVKSGGKTVTAKVAAAAAPQFQGFINDLKASGYPIQFMGGWRSGACAPPRHKHPCGWALDVNQYSRDVVRPRMMSRSLIERIAARHGLFSGSAWPNYPDTGHFELTSASIAALNRPKKPMQTAALRPAPLPLPPPRREPEPYTVPSREPFEDDPIQTASIDHSAVLKEEPYFTEPPLQELTLPTTKTPPRGLMEIIQSYVETKEIVFKPWVVNVCPGDKPLPVGLNTMLKDAHEYFHAAVVVNSAYRSREYNDKLRRRGIRAAKFSQHIKCKAVDFRVVGVSAKLLKVWVVDNRAKWGVKGVGYYGVTGHVHADLRSALKLVVWNGGVKRKVRYAKRHYHHHRRYAKA